MVKTETTAAGTTQITTTSTVKVTTTGHGKNATTTRTTTHSYTMVTSPHIVISDKRKNEEFYKYVNSFILSDARFNKVSKSLKDIFSLTDKVTYATLPVSENLSATLTVTDLVKWQFKSQFSNVLVLEDTYKLNIDESKSSDISLSDKLSNQLLKSLKDSLTFSESLVTTIEKVKTLTDTFSLSTFIKYAINSKFFNSLVLNDKKIFSVEEKETASLSLSDKLYSALTKSFHNSFSILDSLKELVDKELADSFTINDKREYVVDSLRLDSVSLEDKLVLAVDKKYADSFTLSETLTKSGLGGITDETFQASFTISDFLKYDFDYNVGVNSIAILDKKSVAINSLLVGDIQFTDKRTFFLSVSRKDLFSVVDKIGSVVGVKFGGILSLFDKVVQKVGLSKKSTMTVKEKYKLFMFKSLMNTANFQEKLNMLLSGRGSMTTTRLVSTTILFDKPLRLIIDPDIVDSISLSENYTIEYGSTLDLMYSAMMYLKQDISSTFGTSVKIVQVANVKNIDTQRAGNSIVIIPQSVKPVIFGERNYYNSYEFTVRVYSAYMSSTYAFSSYWKYIDNFMRNDLMSIIIGNKLIKGGVVVGYASSGDLTPNINERGIRYVNYTTQIDVVV